MEITVKKGAYDTQEVAAIALLPANQSVFIHAMVAPRIVDLTTEEAIQSIFKTLKTAEVLSGLTKLDNQDVIVLATTSYNLIKDTYPALTVAEFEICCRNGVINEFGQWYGFCLKSVNQWIKGYTTQERRLTAIKDWNKAIEQKLTSEKPVYITPEYLKRAALTAFEEYKTGKLPMVPHAIYDTLCELIGTDYNHPTKGLIKILITDRAKAKELYKQAESDFTKELEIKNKRASRSIAADIAQITSDLNGNKTFEFRVKKYYLVFFFKKLIENNKTLEL